jgi:hypothetical protein
VLKSKFRIEISNFHPKQQVAFNTIWAAVVGQIENRGRPSSKKKIAFLT